jgi:hypothetical protein
MGRTAEELAKKRYAPSILPTDIIESLFISLNEEPMPFPLG